MDDKDDIVDEVPKADPVLSVHPATGAGEVRGPKDAEAVVPDPAQLISAVPDDAVIGEIDPPAETPLDAIPRLYRLRSPGLRPAPRPRRGRRATILRSDCPPDLRREDETDSRTRLR